MKNYYIPREKALDTQLLGEILMDYQTAVLPVLNKRKRYYDGKQKILDKVFANSDKIPSRIVSNFVKSIVDSYSGYAVGIPPRIESGEEDGGRLDDILNYNDSDEQIMQLYTDALIYGRSDMLAYVDREGKPRFAVIEPTTVVPVYSDDLEREMLYAIRFWTVELNKTDVKYWVEVYDGVKKSVYISAPGFAAFSLMGDEVHHFNQVPLVHMELNRDEVSVCDESVFTLNDMYNSLLSDANDNEDAFADSMLVLKGQFADEEDIESMKRNRVLMLDADGDAQYLIKSMQGTMSDSLLDRVEEKIRTLTGCPDFGSDEFKSSSGIAIRYRLLAMENNTANHLSRFKKALQKLVELLAGITELSEGEAAWRDCKITFQRNLPIDETANANVVNTLKGTVSTETLLGLLPFVDNPEDELKKVEAEDKKARELYVRNVADVQPDIEAEE